MFFDKSIAQHSIMKKENLILLSIGIGLISVFSILKLTKQRNRKKKFTKVDFNDEHRHFDSFFSNDDQHGIELHAMK
jgi:hypothetical protein